MPVKIDINLSGTVFTDEQHTDVGASAFEIDHDFFSQEDLVIRTAAGGGGTLLVEDTDYSLLSQDSYLSEQSVKTVYRNIQVTTGAYQTGILFFSGKYIADANDAEDWHIPLDVPVSWMKSLAATRGTTLHSGSADTDLTMALKDMAANFSNVAFGDIVENTDTKEFAMVLYKSGADTLYLTSDIFPAGTEAYAVYSEPAVPADFVELTGALLDGDGVVSADTNTVNHLIDADGTDWTTDVSVDDWAMNLTTGKVAKITAVAAHDLTLQWDAFPNGNEAYMIFAGYLTVDDSASPHDGLEIPEMNVSGRFSGGGLASAMAEDDKGQAHWHSLYINPGIAPGGGAGDDNYGSNAINLITFNNRIREAQSDGEHGDPRTGEHTQPRTLRAVMIMRIK